MNSIKKYFYNFYKPHSAIIDSVLTSNLTYLSKQALTNLYDQAYNLENNKTQGIFIEAGCALGGSAIVLAKAKSKFRPLHIYDVFDMIPPPSNKDGEDVHSRYETIKSGKSKGISGNTYYGYEKDLLKKVICNFENYQLPLIENNIFLFKGLFENTLKINNNVALAHIDGDWYESVFTCLERIEPKLVNGGVLIIDDYYSWSGCKLAVDEYFKDKRNNYIFSKKARLNIKKIKPVNHEEK